MRIYVIILILLGWNPLMGQSWDHIIEDLDTTGTIRLVGEMWNNTLIKNCTIHNTGANKDGIFLREVKNVRIENCKIYDIEGMAGIRMSISGQGTDSVVIENNTIYNVQENGISAPQRSQNEIPLNQDHLIINNNTIYNTGLGSSNGLHHAIYCQAADFIISNNKIYGIRNGNGLSVRSSGKISGNVISGYSKSNKPAIRYYSDHFTGPSDTLLVENNILYNDQSAAHTLDIYDFAPLFQGSNSDSHIVKNINIRFNTILSFQPNKYSVRISEDFAKNGYSSTIEGNVILHTKSVEGCITAPLNTKTTSNVLIDQFENFVASVEPYDFHILKSHIDVDYVGTNSMNHPTHDIDGDPRIGKLDAGADEYVLETSLIDRKLHDSYTLFPNPCFTQDIVHLHSNQNIHSVTVFDNSGIKILELTFQNRSKSRDLFLNDIKPGNYFIQINHETTIPFYIIE